MRCISAIDLHVHTSYSDGKYAPEELLRHAAALGITTLAFTDHDNANGFRAALPIAQEFGIDLIPAIEFTCRWPYREQPAYDDDVDVLGYFVDVNDPIFQAYEQAALQDAFARIGDRCVYLTDLGYPISLMQVFAENPHYVGGIQLALAIQHNGYAEEWREALRIIDLSRYQIRSSSFTVFQAIEQIHRAGGIAVLAHPTTLFERPARLQADQLSILVEMGLDGLEVYHHHVHDEERAYFLELAREFDLVVSGGSDEHGWTTGLSRIGTQPISFEMLELLRARHVERL